jgi:hypothetical protein
LKKEQAKNDIYIIFQSLSRKLTHYKPGGELGKAPSSAPTRSEHCCIRPTSFLVCGQMWKSGKNLNYLKRADTEYFSHQKLLHLLAESEL